MTNDQIHCAMDYLDPQLIQAAAQPKNKKKTRLRPVVLAACLVLLLIPVMAVTGSLLVEHYYGDAIPENLADQNLDAFFQVNTAEKVPVVSFSPELREGEPGTSHYTFDTLDAAEELLGLEILNLELDHQEHSVQTTYADGSLVDAPCNLTLLYNSERQLYAVSLQYFFRIRGGVVVTLNATAVTDRNPNDNNASIGVSNDGAQVVQQSDEVYTLESGAQATIIATEYSDSHGWDAAGWMEQNGFVFHFSLSAADRETGVETVRDLLNSVR